MLSINPAIGKFGVSAYLPEMQITQQGSLSLYFGFGEIVNLEGQDGEKEAECVIIFRKYGVPQLVLDKKMR